jgi:hypothetical protein
MWTHNHRLVMWFKVHRNVNDIRKQIIAFIKKHIIILFTHKSIHNSDRKGIKYRMSYPCWSTTWKNLCWPLVLLSPGMRYKSRSMSKSWCWILYIITSLLILLRCSKAPTSVNSFNCVIVKCLVVHSLGYISCVCLACLVPQNLKQSATTLSQGP